jgi:hypothetical protein
VQRPLTSAGVRRLRAFGFSALFCNMFLIKLADVKIAKRNRDLSET